MNSTLLPNEMELNYRKVHYKNVQNVLDGIIFCSICNADLKETIILNEKIMVHKTFLCLCCKNCFEKLSDSPNGCILCSTETQLKTCEICHHHMCQSCIYNYYMKSKKLKKLKGCLKCSCNVLWSLRSQAIAVLKCYSFELDSRLLLNGKESEDKQCLYEFLKNSAKSNDNFTLKVLNDMRIKYFYDKLISKTQPLYNKILKSQIENLDQSPTILNTLCKQVLENTCSVLFDFKCLFNDQIAGLLYNKIKSILDDPVLFKTNENNYKERLKYYHETKNALECGFNKTCYVSLVKLDEKDLKPQILKAINNKTTEDSEKVNHDIENVTNFSMETQSHQQDNLDLTCVNSNQPKPANVPHNIFMNLGEIEIKLKEKIIDHHVEEKVCGETVNQVTTCNTKFNSDNKNLDLYPVVYLHKMDEELINNNTEKKCENEDNKIYYEENTTIKTKNTNKKKRKSIKCDSKLTDYIHKKFRREERLKIKIN